MAGVIVGEDAESPVAVNVTPLVDIIFCLCVFFMISFKFKQLEGRFEAWLPRTTGPCQGPPIVALIGELRVALFWDEAKQRTVRQLGLRRIHDDEELGRLLLEAHDAGMRMNKPDIPVTIDAEGTVPWNDVVEIMNLCKKSHIDKIEFAVGAPPSRVR